MIVYKLLDKYNALFGFKKTLNENLRKSVWVNVFLLLYIGSVVWFIFSLFDTQWIYSIVSLISIIVCIYVGQKLNRRILTKRYKSIYAYYKDKQEVLRKIIEDDFGLKKHSDQEVLLKVIDNELEQYRSIREFPFKNLITQFISALIITGLLTTSFNLLKDGENEQAVPLLTLYISLIGLVIIIGGGIYAFRSFSKPAKLSELKTAILQIRLNKLIKDGIFEEE